MKKKTIIVIIISCLLITIYVCIGFYFNNHFFANTTFNGIDISRMSIREADKKIELEENTIMLTLDSRTTSYKINVKNNKSQYPSNFFKKGFKWNWITECCKTHNIEVDNTNFIKEEIEKTINNWDIFDETKWEYPQNAKIIFDDEEKRYVVKKESLGTAFDKGTVIEIITNAITKKESVNIEDFGVYYIPHINQKNKKLLDTCQQMNSYIDKEIVYQWNDSKYIVNSDILKHYMKYNEETYEVFFDAEQAATEIKGSLSLFFEKETHKFITHDNKEIFIYGGNWGGFIDGEKMQEEIMKNLLENESEGTLQWKLKGLLSPADNQGNYIEIDLSNQKLYLYQNNKMIIESDIVSGNVKRGMATPPGVFKLIRKSKNAILYGPGYASPVKYWMQFNRGIGMHDASWRNKFGGTIYKESGSHGCINMPLKNAETVYNHIDNSYLIYCYS